MIDLPNLKWRMVALDQQIHPIAHRPVDISKPGWTNTLASRRHPFDEAGVRNEGEALLRELLAGYAVATDLERQSIRGYVETCRSFAWAATLPFDPDTRENLRQHLLLFSMHDQGQDSRDAILLLQALCQTAKKAGVHPAAILREVAALSSATNKYGMGSTRDMLLKACD